jgi:hypothetical protein
MNRVLRATILAVVFLAVVALPVYGFLTNPTSMEIKSARAFRNLAENGDIAIVFHAKEAFASYPTTPASSTIMYRLNSSNGTLMKTASPYVFSLFENYGYGDAVSIFYFAPSENCTWGGAYNINILGLPAYFTGLLDVNYSLTTADWNTAAIDTTTQQEEMRDYIFGLCDDFQGIYPDVPLKTTTDGDISLSVYGESYFIGAIPGLNSLCPQLFFSQIYVPQVIATDNYTMEQGEDYGHKTDSKSDLVRGADRIGALFGIGGKTLFVILVNVAAVLLCVWTNSRGWGIEPGMATSVVVGIFIAYWLGDTMWSLLMIGSLVLVMAIFYIIFLKRA